MYGVLFFVFAARKFVTGMGGWEGYFTTGAQNTLLFGDTIATATGLDLEYYFLRPSQFHRVSIDPSTTFSLCEQKNGLRVRIRNKHDRSQPEPAEQQSSNGVGTLLAQQLSMGYGWLGFDLRDWTDPRDWALLGGRVLVLQTMCLRPAGRPLLSPGNRRYPYRAYSTKCRLTLREGSTGGTLRCPFHFNTSL